MSETSYQELEIRRRWGEIKTANSVPLYRADLAPKGSGKVDFVVDAGGKQGGGFGIVLAEETPSYFKSNKLLDPNRDSVFLAYRRLYSEGDKDIPGAVYALKKTSKSASFLNAVDEGRQFAFLEHPNIATVYNLLGDKEHNLYILYELLLGERLKEVNQKALRPSTIHEIVFQMCSAVSFLHKNGRLHNDIKPSNFVFKEKFDENGSNKLKMIDFGAVTSKIQGEKWVSPHVGTMGYTYPDFADWGPHSDVFGLTASIGELVFDNYDPSRGRISMDDLRFKKTFRHKNRETLNELRRIIRKGAGLNSTERYKTVPELYNDLNQVFMKLGSDFEGQELNDQ